ncbi:MAG: cardiolipin synthase [Thiotrichales bacterium]|nr:MAG: cardiolipin synthase [Thiotrichales bacterium]
MLDMQGLSLIGYILVVAEILGVLLALNVVMQPRSSQGTIAWFIALIALPVVTVPLYAVFGRTRFQGYSEALREAVASVEARAREWLVNMNAMAAQPRPQLEPIESLTRKLTQLPFLGSNKVELLIDGEETYENMIRAIEAAESYVLVQFYIVRDDAIGRRMRDALVARARSGVSVFFLYDEIGSIKLPDAYLQVMRDAGIAVSGFKTTKGRSNRFQINFRNHRKLLVADGRTGFIGGNNLGEEYLVYRDTHLRMDGPAAQHIQLSFAEDWYWATETLIPASPEIVTAENSDQAVAIVNTGPADTLANCSILFSTLISQARSRLWITSPYFVPNDAIVVALQAAALRGVDVRIILPDVADQVFVELASYTYYDDMLNNGVRLYRYREHFMHQKVILVDDTVAGIGTVNLDNRSIYLNFEATALVADAGFISEVEAMLLDDLENSTPVQCEHYDRKPLPYRIACQIARLASPLL